MVKKGWTAAGIAAALLMISGVSALAAAATPDVAAPGPAPERAVERAVAPAQAADGLASRGACAGDPGLAALFQRQAAPLLTPFTPDRDLVPRPAPACNSCIINRGCFPCGPAAIDQAPCAITVCCGVETNRVCGTCSDHCVPPPA